MDDKTIPLQRVSVSSKMQTRMQYGLLGDDFHYRALFEQTGECVFIITMDFRYIAVNQQALSLLGYEEHELLGTPVSDIMSQDDALGHGPVSERQSNLYERILRRKDGSTLPVEISTSVIYDEQNKPAYIQSIARDISERKSAEQMLKRQAQILSVLNTATAKLLRASNIQTKIPEVLESLGQAMGVYCCSIFEINTFSAKPYVTVLYQWADVRTSTFDLSSIIGPFVPDILNTRGKYFSLHDVTDQGGSFSMPSFVSVPIDGHPGSWRYLGFFDEKKNLLWSLSESDAAQTAADLIGSALQRNFYEETIKLNEMRNRIMLNALPDLLIRISVDGEILDYSANAEHPLYIHRDMISGKKLSQTWPEEIVATIIGKSNTRGFTKSHFVEEFRLPYSNSTFESRLYPINLNEALIVIRDITEQVKLNEMKSDFINRASHELRTPLTSAILMVDLIQEGGTPDELDEYWRTLIGELNRQKVLIDRLLIAGRLESGMMKLETVPMDLMPVLEESMTAVKPIANKRKVVLKLLTGSAPVQILGDKSGLQQVFINLFNNAAKFSPAGGAVEISVLQNNSSVQVEIRDHGVGIPDDAIPHLFERFYRAKNVTIAEIPGSGIGLYIVKSIVEELGGTIHVKSVLNEGTTFTVVLKTSQ
jgi:PAS domain S-box-containing protein